MESAAMAYSLLAALTPFNAYTVMQTYISAQIMLRGIDECLLGAFLMKK